MSYQSQFIDELSYDFNSEADLIRVPHKATHNRNDSLILDRNNRIVKDRELLVS